MPTATYVVKVDAATLPNGGAGLTNTIDPGDPTPNQATVNLSGFPGGVNLAQDFGYTATTPGAVSGTLWNDSNADGALGGTEPGRYGGVTVALLDSNGDVVATTTTAAERQLQLPEPAAGQLHGGRDRRRQRAGRDLAFAGHGRTRRPEPDRSQAGDGDGG